MGSRDHSIECETCGLSRGGMNDDRCACDRPHEIVADEFVKALDALLVAGLEAAPASNSDLARTRDEVVAKLRQLLAVENLKRGLGALLNQLMRVNTQMFEGVIRILGQHNQLLHAQVGYLVAEVARLARDDQSLVASATFDKPRALDAVAAFDAGQLSALALAGYLPGAIARIDALEDGSRGALRMIEGIEQPGVTIQAIEAVLRSALARNFVERDP